MQYFSATEQIITKDPKIVNKKKNDGFSALHLAALNGHVKVTKLLIEKGGCDVDLRNDKEQTPLHLGVSQVIKQYNPHTSPIV